MSARIHCDTCDKVIIGAILDKKEPMKMVGRPRPDTYIEFSVRRMGGPEHVCVDCIKNALRDAREPEGK